MNQDQMPTIEELTSAPELAALAALHSAIEVATRALLAAHPELCEDRIPRTKLLAVVRGHRLLNLTGKTQALLALYRQAVAPDRRIPPDATDDLDLLAADD